MSICQRSNGSWAVKYKDPTSGKWRQRQFRDRSSAAAFDAQATLAAEKDLPITLREAFMAYIQSRPLSRRRVRHLTNMLRPDGPAGQIADRLAESLNRRDLEAVRSKAMSGRGSTDAANKYCADVSCVLRWCASEELIPRNPWANYRIFLPHHVRHLTGSLDDLLRIYAHLPAWLQWAVKTAMALCLRPGLAELFSLEWSAFDWRAGTVEVYMPKVQRTKLAFAPAWYLSEARTFFAICQERSVQYVCPTTTGRKATTQDRYSRPWAAACRAAGVEMPFYAIRHIAASEMLANGADLAAVSAQLGHLSITTTAAFYTHALAKAQRIASGTIPELVGFGGGPGRLLQRWKGVKA